MSSKVSRKANIPLGNFNSCRLSLFTYVLPPPLLSARPQVRIAALTVLADSRRTSELFEPVELRLIVRFVAGNLANQTPAFRQQLLALLKKVRWLECETGEK